MNPASPTIDHQQDSLQVVDAALQRLKSLATLPQSAIEIMRLAEDEHAVAQDFQKVIVSDPSLSSRILKVVNSTFYSVPRQIESIQQAVVFLGSNAVKNIAIAGSCHKLFQSRRSGGSFDAAELWQHSVAVAVTASLLARINKLVSPEEAYLAGIVHDIGIIAQLQIFDSSFADALALQSAGEFSSLREAERFVFGATHEDFGRGLCQKWNFPPSLVSVTGFHHQPNNSPKEHRTLTSIVHLADIMAANCNIGFTATVEQDSIDEELLSEIQLSRADVETLAESLAEKIHEAYGAQSISE